MPYLVGSSAEEDLRWQYFLASAKLSNAERSSLLLSVKGTSSQQYESPFTQLSAIASLVDPNRAEVSARRMIGNGGSWHSALSQRSVFLVHRGERLYPTLLNHCSDAPPVLFCQGDLTLLQRPAIAVVGARRPSRDGCAAAYALGGQLASQGLVVVSGLARGIDAQAHAGALSVGGATIAVMATGLDRIYPSTNTRLANSIVEQGLLLTEFPPYVNPERWHFPRRNRTLSGLCLGTVVVEAGRPSGSLLTATAAAEQGREVFAYPWSIYHKGGEGCRYLLGDGAHLAQCAEDVVLGLTSLSADSFGPPVTRPLTQKPSSTTPLKQPALGDELAGDGANALVANIVAIIGDAAIDLPQLCQLTGRNASELAVELARLEIAGTVVSSPLGYRLKRTNMCSYPF